APRGIRDHLPRSGGHPHRGVPQCRPGPQPRRHPARSPVRHRHAGPGPRRHSGPGPGRGLRLLRQDPGVPPARGVSYGRAAAGRAYAYPVLRRQRTPSQSGHDAVAETGAGPHPRDGRGRFARRRRSRPGPRGGRGDLALLDARAPHQRQDALLLRPRTGRLGHRVRVRRDARGRGPLHGRRDHRGQLLGPRLVRVRAAGGHRMTGTRGDSTTTDLSTYGPWAVIAGGSEAVGAEFAHQLARAGLNLVLIARNEEALEATAEAVRAHGTEVRTLVQDLLAEDAVANIAARTADLEVGLLVVNAGANTYGHEFVTGDLDAFRRVMTLNIDRKLELTQLFGAP